MGSALGPTAHQDIRCPHASHGHRSPVGIDENRERELHDGRWNHQAAGHRNEQSVTDSEALVVVVADADSGQHDVAVEAFKRVERVPDLENEGAHEWSC